MSSKPPFSEFPELDPAKIPVHVAVIMDGNGRWAKKRLMNRVRGHEKGVETVRNIVTVSREIGIEVLTLYAFSTENWNRPEREINALMSILSRFLASERREMIDNNIRFNTIGQTDRLSDAVKRELDKTFAATDQNNGMILNLALSYGSRAEIVRMVRLIAHAVEQKRIDPGSIDEDTISRHLYTAGMQDPDLLIRTSGESRISNFLLWQIAYSEIAITDTLWPDFTRDEYIRMLIDYQKRERRFGKVFK